MPVWSVISVNQVPLQTLWDPQSAAFVLLVMLTIYLELRIVRLVLRAMNRSVSDLIKIE
jgi:hypothetical protein